MRAFALFAFLSVSIVLVLSVAISARPAGSPTGYTGGPENGGRNCTSCHSGTANSGPGQVQINAPAVYRPGSVVPVTVSLSNLQNPLANGMQMAAFDGSNQVLPGWTRIDTNNTINANYVNQTRTGNKLSSWKVYLTTPSTPTAFRLYVAGLDGNDDGDDKGDRTYTTSTPMAAGTVNLSMTSLPRVGSSAALALDAPGDGGKTYVMAASFGNSGVPIGSRIVPLSLDTLFALSVQNVLPTIFVGFQGTLDASGAATAAVAVPPIAGLAGVTIHLAYVVVDPGRPGGIGTISNGVPMTLF